MTGKGGEFEREIARLEAEIRRLEAEYNMFFAGRLPRLPWETRRQVEALVTRLDRMNLVNTAQRFRLDAIQSRFNAFCDLWERNLRTREEGRAIRGHRAPAPVERRVPPATPDAYDDPAVTLRDPAQDSARLMDLYEKVSEARRTLGESPLPYHRFVAAVRAQVSKVGGGQQEVAFRVAVKDGKVTLTAKPAKP